MWTSMSRTSSVTALLVILFIPYQLAIGSTVSELRRRELVDEVALYRDSYVRLQHTAAKHAAIRLQQANHINDKSSAPPISASSDTRRYRFRATSEGINDDIYHSDDLLQQLALRFNALRQHADATPVITSVMPLSFPSCGGDIITIHGTNLLHYDGITLEDDVYTCAFDIITAHSTATSSTNRSRLYSSGAVDPLRGTVQCITPNFTLMDVSDLSSVQLTLAIRSRNESRVHHVCRAPQTLLVYEKDSPLAQPRLQSIIPKAGPTSGGTIVMLKGAFLRGRAYVCTFGQQSSPAVHDPNELRNVLQNGDDQQQLAVPLNISDAQWDTLFCVVPAMLSELSNQQPGVTPVEIKEVTDFGTPAQSNALSFHYYEQLVLSAPPVPQHHIAHTDSSVLLPVTSDQIISLQRHVHTTDADTRITELLCRFAGSIISRGVLDVAQRGIVCLVPPTWQILTAKTTPQVCNAPPKQVQDPLLSLMQLDVADEGSIEAIMQKLSNINERTMKFRSVFHEMLGGDELADALETQSIVTSTRFDALLEVRGSRHAMGGRSDNQLVLQPGVVDGDVVVKDGEQRVQGIRIQPETLYAKSDQTAKTQDASTQKPVQQSDTRGKAAADAENAAAIKHKLGSVLSPLNAPANGDNGETGGASDAALNVPMLTSPVVEDANDLVSSNRDAGSGIVPIVSAPPTPNSASQALGHDVIETATAVLARLQCGEAESLHDACNRLLLVSMHAYFIGNTLSNTPDEVIHESRIYALRQRLCTTINLAMDASCTASGDADLSFACSAYTTLKNSRLLECVRVTPQRCTNPRPSTRDSQTLNVTVEVSLNGQQWVSPDSPISLHFAVAAGLGGEVVRHPHIVATAGGTVLRVGPVALPRPLVSKLQVGNCSFGGLMVPAFVDYADHNVSTATATLLCKAPPLHRVQSWMLQHRMVPPCSNISAVCEIPFSVTLLGVPFTFPTWLRAGSDDARTSKLYVSSVPMIRAISSPVLTPSSRLYLRAQVNGFPLPAAVIPHVKVGTAGAMRFIPMRLHTQHDYLLVGEVPDGAQAGLYTLSVSIDGVNFHRAKQHVLPRKQMQMTDTIAVVPPWHTYYAAPSRMNASGEVVEVAMYSFWVSQRLIPNCGEMHVTLHAEGVAGASSISCRFGHVIVPATNITLLETRTNATIHLSGFAVSGAAVSKYGNHSTAPIRQITQFMCRSPPLAALLPSGASPKVLTDVSLSISLDDGNTWTQHHETQTVTYYDATAFIASGMQSTYTVDGRIAAVEVSLQLNSSQSATAAGVLLDQHSRNIDTSPYLQPSLLRLSFSSLQPRCRWAGKYVTTAYLTRETLSIRCLAPHLLDEADASVAPVVPIELSLNNGEVWHRVGMLPAAQQTRKSKVAVTPKSGPLSGGTLIGLTGFIPANNHLNDYNTAAKNNGANNSSLWCLFGAPAGSKDVYRPVLSRLHLLHGLPGFDGIGQCALPPLHMLLLRNDVYEVESVGEVDGVIEETRNAAAAIAERQTIQDAVAAGIGKLRVPTSLSVVPTTWYDAVRGEVLEDTGSDLYSASTNVALSILRVVDGAFTFACPDCVDLDFQYVSPPQVYDFSQRFVSIVGGTEILFAFRGSGVSRGMPAIARFGRVTASGVVTAPQVFDNVLQQQQACGWMCSQASVLSPPLSPGMYTAELSYNGQDYSVAEDMLIVAPDVRLQAAVTADENDRVDVHFMYSLWDDQYYLPGRLQDRKPDFGLHSVANVSVVYYLVDRERHDAEQFMVGMEFCNNTDTQGKRTVCASIRVPHKATVHVRHVSIQCTLPRAVSTGDNVVWARTDKHIVDDFGGQGMDFIVTPGKPVVSHIPNTMHHVISALNARSSMFEAQSAQISGALVSEKEQQMEPISTPISPVEAIARELNELTSNEHEANELKTLLASANIASLTRELEEMRTEKAALLANDSAILAETWSFKTSHRDDMPTLPSVFHVPMLLLHTSDVKGVGATSVARWDETGFVVRSNHKHTSSMMNDADGSPSGPYTYSVAVSLGAYGLACVYPEAYHVSLDIFTGYAALPDSLFSSAEEDAVMCSTTQSGGVACEDAMIVSGEHMHANNIKVPADIMITREYIPVSMDPAYAALPRTNITTMVEEAAVTASIRFVPAVMFNSPVPYPTTLIARRRFDSDVIADISHATGTSKSRWHVASAHSSGVVVLVCTPMNGETACRDAIQLLHSLVQSRSPVLIMGGIVTWALDPLFPSLSIDMIDGVPHVAGVCSNPTLITRELCENAGVCSCKGVPPNDKQACITSLTAGGSPCEFMPEFAWMQDVLKPLQYGTCSDPNILDASTCLEAGTCSVPSPAMQSRSACLEEGICTVPADLAASVKDTIDFGQFVTRQECEDPTARRRKEEGRCVTTEAGPVDYPFYKFETKMTCEVPKTRKIPAGSNNGYICQSPPGFTGNYAFHQHTTQVTCEQPAQRAQCPDCGPVGVWVDVFGPVGRWVPTTRTNTPSTLREQWDYTPGRWVSRNHFTPSNAWRGGSHGAVSADPCPCNWQSIPYHLSKCNWWRCGPGSKSTGSDGYAKILRNKDSVEMVSDYQTMVSVGGRKLWMNIDTGTSTSWVMSKACFMEGCREVELFAGAFIPTIPPQFVIIDLLERGLMQIGSMAGFLGHTTINVAGKSVTGAPVAMGILDIGNVGETSFNHSGVVGLGFWEENWPNWILPRDPSLSVLDFMRCGSIFYPIPMVPLPIPKPFQLWALPPFFPAGYVFKFAMFFSDRGGCFFMNGAPSHFARKGLSSVMLLPLPAIKWIAPSWMLILQDIRVNGKSIKPCLIPPLCRAVIRTGQFSITGPMYPMLALLEEVAAPSTCENIENLPDVTFVIMGKEFTMTRNDYVIFGQQFDDISCMTAFTPEAQLIPGFELWGLGDAFVRAFYTVFHDLPLRRVEMGPADHRYYEKNGCAGGDGQGPLIRWSPPEQRNTAQANAQKQAAIADATKGRMEEDMHWKRRQNWEADLKGQVDDNDERAKNAALGAPFGMCGPSGDTTRFRMVDGECVPLQDAEPAAVQRSMGVMGLGLVKVSDIAPSEDGRVLSASQRMGLTGVFLEETPMVTGIPETVRQQLSEQFGREFATETHNAVLSFRRSARRDRIRAGTDASSHITQSLHHEVAVTSLLEVRARNLTYHNTPNKHGHHAELQHAVPHGGAYWDGSSLDRDSALKYKEISDPWVAYLAAGAITVLPELGTNIKDSAAETALIRNMSIVYAHMARVMNISDEQSARYWRGESEEWQDEQRVHLLAKYRKQVKDARQIAAEHYQKSKEMIHSLRNVVRDLTLSVSERKKSLDTCLSRMGLLEGPTGDIQAADDTIPPDVAEASVFPYLNQQEQVSFDTVVREKDDAFTSKAVVLLEYLQQSIDQHQLLMKQHISEAEAQLNALVQDLPDPAIDMQTTAKQLEKRVEITKQVVRRLRGQW